MKIIRVIIIIYSMFYFSSCTDILNTTSRDTLTDGTVWNNEDAIMAYMSKMYDVMQTEDLSYSVIEEGGFPSTLTDEAVRAYTWGNINNPTIPDSGFNWWGYGAIREVNVFIQRIPDAPISEDKKSIFQAEARFLRAFYYFSLVKRYGGVPLITIPQEFTGDNIAELQVPRNKEKEIYDFIKDEIDEIVSELPEKWDGSNAFRATCFSAYALKSRAMLYAASIAKYGEVKYDGVVGIPAADANFYWEESKKASLALMTSNKFTLYKSYDNKEENFQNLFLEKTMHSEAIFTKPFSSPDKGHSFDFYNAAQSFKVDYGCVTNPTLQIVEEFDYVDGSSGELKVNDSNGDPILFDNPYELFKNKDPRLLASVLLPFSLWQNDILEIRKGIIDGKEEITASNMTDTYGSGENAIPIVGKDGIIDINDPTKTGFYIKKFMNPSDRINQGQSDTYWMIFRYAEILLNYAEASIELGKDISSALEAINEIRDRAGVAKLKSLSLDDVRHERMVELAFENHRWWDLRRWRKATDVLNNFQARALHPYLVWEEGKDPKDMKYIFKRVNAPKNTRTFLPKLYYVNIPADQMSTNPNLIPNPEY